MKTTKLLKAVSSLMLVCVLTMNFAMMQVRAEETTMSVTLRVEGINETMYYETVEVPFTESLTLQTALLYMDEQADSLTITGADAAYITDINGDAAGAFGGWDGWLYRVNDVEATTGIDGCILNDGDSIVLFYGDPYGVGMQFPEVDASQLADNLIRLTSKDTTFDASYNATVTVNPVVGATVTWGYGTESAEYTTDENGEIVIDQAQMTAENHSIQVTKTAESGIPLVLRLASDVTVAVAADNTANNTGNETTAVEADSTEAADSDSTEAVVTADSSDAVPQTGDSILIVYGAVILLIIATAGIAGCTIYRTKKHQ